MSIRISPNPALPNEYWDETFADRAFTKDPDQEGLLPHIPFARLNIPFDHKGMADEARRLLPYFIDDNEAMARTGLNPSRSPRMKRISLDLCKLDGQNRWTTKTQLRTAQYALTRYAEDCPITMRFVQEVFPHVHYHDFGFRILMPGGYLDKHIDKFPGRMSLSFALTNPVGAVFLVEGVGVVPIREGEGWMINTENCIHKVQNTSREMRIHLALNGEFTHNPEFRKLALCSYEPNREFFNSNYVIQKTYPAEIELDGPA